MGQQRVDQRRGRRPNRGRLHETRLAGQRQPQHFLGRQVRQVRQALARRCRPVMGGDQLVLRVVQLHGARPRAEPQRLAHQPIGRRVVGALKGDVAVAVDRDALPDRRDVGGRRQRPQRGLLDRAETLQRLLLGRAVCAPSRDLDTPAA